ncbi:two component transcriptional regulator, LuxR family [Chitinophaga sp. YR573]|uniref:response regulator transcription factor n=1 Tax=Chitinophaga sp. YR573 TaxID=1881040 RepID=UPI0008CC0585|nr:response regulator transcription factor [Chitinophaga sp. YR573]SEW44385.1 two component transcriptional regulator, LuxR family [Chitinophaga sp. YR573]
MIYTGLVEDQVLFREGMKAIIGTWQDMEVVFESADGYSVLDKLKECAVIPDVMLVDLSLPPDGKTEYSGLHVTRALTSAFPDMKILILSVHEDENFINQLIESGAHGYLVKDSDPQEVQEAIIAVYNKGSYINERTLKALQHKVVKKTKNKWGDVPITRREEEILQLVCKQYTAEEIAQELFISVKTVNGHRNNLLQKTGSRNVTGLVLYAIRNNIVTL